MNKQMDKRKEAKFDPERQIDFVKLIGALDWTNEINPVSLVKAVNKVANLKGIKKYETNEKSFGSLIKSFEMRVSRFVSTRFQGKDRFYRLKEGCTVEQMLAFAKTGEVIKPKEIIGEKKYYIPEVKPEEVAIKRERRVFPDNEALMKTIIILKYLKKGNGESVGSEVRSFVESNAGWKRQRSVCGKLMSAYQEATKILTEYLDLPEKTLVVNHNKTKFNGDLSKIDGYIDSLISLIDGEEEMSKILAWMTLIDGKESKKEEEEENVVVIPTRKKTTEVVYTSPDTNAPKQSVALPTVEPFEGIKSKWNKSLIAEVIRREGRGTRIEYIPLSGIIKKNRFVDIQVTDLKSLIREIQSQFPNIFYGIDSQGFSISSEKMLTEFWLAYDQKKITEQVFMRLKMSLKDLTENYPDLKFEVASEINEEDNIYSIIVDRTSKAERALTKLVWGMRKGETILESPNNWTFRRVNLIMSKLGLTELYVH